MAVISIALFRFVARKSALETDTRARVKIFDGRCVERIDRYCPLRARRDICCSLFAAGLTEYFNGSQRSILFAGDKNPPSRMSNLGAVCFRVSQGIL